MGWYYQNKPSGQSVKEFFSRMYKHDGEPKSRLLDLAVVGLRTAYGAFRTDDGRVIGLVILLDYRKSDVCGFGYKDMDESMGPNEVACPERIYQLLTPLQDGDGFAADWRAKVEAYHARRRAVPTLQDGNTVKFAVPLSFGSFGTHDTFTVRHRGRQVVFEHGYVTYRISHWRDRSFQVLTS